MQNETRAPIDLARELRHDIRKRLQTVIDDTLSNMEEGNDNEFMIGAEAMALAIQKQFWFGELGSAVTFGAIGMLYEYSDNFDKAIPDDEAVTELRSLPIGTTIMDQGGYAYQKYDDNRWYRTNDATAYDNENVTKQRGFFVLYRAQR